ncbi:glycosyltransferase family 2 protein [Cohnella sp. 56]|uniref:glycosyltransferase family 2 protein n=1 Tax=Cohnella sp. 56 TaxID=3113722 RepID=UPI0030E97F66
MGLFLCGHGPYDTPASYIHHPCGPPHTLQEDIHEASRQYRCPLYNVADYLPRCLDSLRGQTLADIEIIAVDDGSTDRSAEVLARYAAEDDRIKVIRQNNQGQGAARNAGLNAAAGRFIGFVDADDWAEPGMFETMYARALETDADICACDYNTVYDHRVLPNALGLAEVTFSIAECGIDR